MDLRNARTWKNRLRPKRLFRAKLRNYEKNLRQKVICICYFAIDRRSEYLTGPSFFFGICPSPVLLPVSGPCERYMTPTLDAALLISSRAGADPGLLSDSGVFDASPG